MPGRRFARGSRIRYHACSSVPIVKKRGGSRAGRHRFCSAHDAASCSDPASYESTHQLQVRVCSAHALTGRFARYCFTVPAAPRGSERRSDWLSWMGAPRCSTQVTMARSKFSLHKESETGARCIEESRRWDSNPRLVAYKATAVAAVPRRPEDISFRNDGWLSLDCARDDIGGRGRTGFDSGRTVGGRPRG